MSTATIDTPVGPVAMSAYKDAFVGTTNLYICEVQKGDRPLPVGADQDLRERQECRRIGHGGIWPVSRLPANMTTFEPPGRRPRWP